MMAQRAVPHIGEHRLARVKPVVNRQVIFRLAALFLYAGLRVVEWVSHSNVSSCVVHRVGKVLIRMVTACSTLNGLLLALTEFSLRSIR
jgi:hypothetical protein